MKNKPSARELAYSTIKEMAINYEFRPDENINEIELSRKLGVSRTPVRDALNQLLNEGLFSFRKNQGFFCRSLDADELFDLAEVRLGLECLAIEHACERGSVESREQLLKFWTEVDAKLDELSSSEIARMDEEFHESIIRMADNAVLLNMIKQINARIRFVRQIEIEGPVRTGADFAEHFKIAEALIRDDVAYARERLVYHITFTREDAMRVLGEGLVRIFSKHKAPTTSRR